MSKLQQTNILTNSAEIVRDCWWDTEPEGPYDNLVPVLVIRQLESRGQEKNSSGMFAMNQIRLSSDEAVKLAEVINRGPGVPEHV
jgi:hypothetical protein